MQDPLAEARRIFNTICPDADFLPAAPDPEDIVWGSEDDVSSEIDKLSSEGPIAALAQPDDNSAIAQQDTSVLMSDEKHAQLDHTAANDAVGVSDNAMTGRWLLIQNRLLAMK